MENFTEIECFKCGVLFAVSKTLQSHWKRDKTAFYCPNGHGQSYIKSTTEELQERLDNTQKQLSETQWAKRELEAENERLRLRKKRCEKKHLTPPKVSKK